MQLRDFLIENDLQMAEFAAQVGTTAPNICRIVAGQVPRKPLMVRIHEVTGGLVTPNDLAGLYCALPCQRPECGTSHAP